MVGVGDRQGPMDLYKNVVIENSLHIPGIEHTLVEHMNVEEYKKVRIKRQLQQGWYQYPENTVQRLSRPVREKTPGIVLVGTEIEQTESVWR